MASSQLHARKLDAEKQPGSPGGAVADGARPPPDAAVRRFVRQLKRTRNARGIVAPPTPEADGRIFTVPRGAEDPSPLGGALSGAWERVGGQGGASLAAAPAEGLAEPGPDSPGQVGAGREGGARPWPSPAPRGRREHVRRMVRAALGRSPPPTPAPPPSPRPRGAGSRLLGVVSAAVAQREAAEVRRAEETPNPVRIHAALAGLPGPHAVDTKVRAELQRKFHVTDELAQHFQSSFAQSLTHWVEHEASLAVR